MNYLIVGLGNIGAEYAGTRHNSGFMVVDHFIEDFEGARFSSDRYASVAEVSFRGNKLTLIKPSTYMNLSGKAVRYWLTQTKCKEDNLLVIVDDIAIPFGTLRMRKAGSDGGHNGLKNITECLGGSNWARLRFGVGSNFSKGAQIDYVLGEWSDEERKAMPELLDRCCKAIKAFITMGPDRAMNICNTKPKEDKPEDKTERKPD